MTPVRVNDSVMGNVFRAQPLAVLKACVVSMLLVPDVDQSTREVDAFKVDAAAPVCDILIPIVPDAPAPVPIPGENVQLAPAVSAPLALVVRNVGPLGVAFVFPFPKMYDP